MALARDVSCLFLYAACVQITIAGLQTNLWALPGGSAIRESPACGPLRGRLRFDLWRFGKIPGEGNGNQLQHYRESQQTESLWAPQYQQSEGVRPD